MTNYQELNQNLEALIKDVPYAISNFANAASLIYQTLSDLNWAGFYFVKDEKLILGPFMGKPACTMIEKGKGVCGSSWQINETLVVADVHKFPGHIACDSASNSEIVIPIHKNNKVIGVLDIDSPILNRFSIEDQIGLEEFVRIIEKYI